MPEPAAPESLRSASQFDTQDSFDPLATNAEGARSSMASFAGVPQPYGEGTVFGSYRLLQLLGEGAMGAVYKAEHIKLKKLVAVKVLPHRFTDEPQVVARFEREMQAIGQLDHAHIVRAMDAGEVQGTHFLVMEYFDGIDLQNYMETRGPRSAAQACEIIRQAALGLAHAHKQGFVHRDIKPSNLLLTKQGKIKLLDLGLARLQDTGPVDHRLTAFGALIGTPDYMAPEQWDNSEAVDGRTDLYGLGCTLFFLLTGRAPFGDDRHQTLGQKLSGHMLEPIPDVRQARLEALENKPATGSLEFEGPLNDAIVEILAKLMAKRPDERFATAEDLITALKAAKTDAAAPPNLTLRDSETAAAASLAREAAARHASTRATSATATRPPRRTDELPRRAEDPPRRADEPPTRPANPRPIPLLPISLLPLSPQAAAIAAGVLVGLALLVAVWQNSGLSPVIPAGAQQFVTDPAGTAPAAPSPAAAVDAWQGSQAGEVRDDNGLRMPFCWCPPGQFRMGSPPGEPGRGSDEGPVSVTLTQGFWMGKHEVTQAEWQRILGTNPSQFRAGGVNEDQVQGLETDRFPVETVSWDVAAAFCRKLTEQEQQAGRLPRNWEYRLPTEAQWEYACRGGTTTATAFGPRLGSGDANFDHSSDAAAATDSLERPAPVGSYRANAWGLQDMHGNVWEWCADWHAGDLPGGVDPVGAVQGTGRVGRGGSWLDPATRCRSAVRNHDAPADRYDALGFRVALVPVRLPAIGGL